MELHCQISDATVQGEAHDHAPHSGISKRRPIAYMVELSADLPFF